MAMGWCVADCCVDRLRAPAARGAASAKSATTSARALRSKFRASRSTRFEIWTNEDLIETRTPTDRYIFAKEDKTAEDQAAEFQAIASCFAPGNQPELTLEQTQKAIAETTQSISDAEDGVAQAKRQVAEDPENLRTRDQAELNRRTAELNRLLEHLHALQVRAQEAASQSYCRARDVVRTAAAALNPVATSDCKSSADGLANAAAL